MTEKEKKTKGISRREFLKDAGLLVGGTAIGSTVLLAACGGEETTKTVTTTAGATTVTDTTTVTAGATTVTDTVTTTVGAGQTATVTETQTTSRFICPIDGMEFDSLADLQAHFEAEHGGAAMPGVITLNVNGNTYLVKTQPNWTLVYVLREKLGLTGTKRPCDAGDCGFCTLIMNGRPILSCLALAIEADGANLETIEGEAGSDGVLSPLQTAFIENDALQCGLCTPGQIMTAKALLAAIPNPTTAEVREYMAGALCRCGAQPNIVKAVLEAAG
jgi:aerobic-type carbon monoxide dehydrogenase small subunit (CoxS/CutS family)